jgi:hypothetical protein
MERKNPTTDTKPAREAQVRTRMARALVANYIHEVSDRHRADDDSPDADGAATPAD